MVSGSTPTPFVGRDDELGVLADELGRDPDVARLVRVSGEAGVGKSRLVAEAVRRSGRRALVGYSSPGSLGRPFDLLLSAVEPPTRGWPSVPGELSGVRTAVTELLRGVAPGLDGDRPPEGISPADLIGAGIALVRHLDPEVIVFEDLHWADLESLQVLERLVSSAEHPVVLVTYRSEDVGAGEPAAELLGTLVRSSRHLHLEPFRSDEVEQVVAEQLGHQPSPLVVDRLRSRTGGNAFFLEEVLAATDLSELVDAAADQFPATLTETVRLRLDGLRPVERDTLATAAVLGSPFEFDLLASALGVDEAELIERLRALIDRRLIIEPEVDVFRFRHELVRESVLSSLLGREKRRLHDRAWTATVEHRANAFAELARHAAASGRLDELARLAPDGIRHYLRRGSTRQALVLAELTLDHQPDDAEILELATRSAWLTGRTHVAQQHAERWRAVSERDPAGCSIDPLSLLARIAYECNGGPDQAEIVTEMERLLDTDLEPTQRARLLTELAQHHMLMGNTDVAIGYAGEARVLAEEHELHGLLLQIGVEQASAEIPAAGADAMQTLARLAKEADAAGEYVTAARALHNLSLYQTPDVADRTLDEMAIVAERGGFDLASAILLPVRKADVAIARADLHDAQQWIGRARGFVHRLKSGRHLRFLEMVIGLETGVDPDPSVLDDFPADAGWVWAAFVRLAARRGDRAELDRLLADPPVGDPATLLAFASALTDLDAAGVDSATIESVRDAVVAADVDQLRGDLASALIAERVGDPAAAGLLEQVVTSENRSERSTKEAPFDAWMDAERSLARARLAARAGDGDERRRHACDAADRLSRWPGPRREAALTLAADDDTTDDDLTGRELDVARLVAQGMTNGQIADELFISRKTVSTHVSHILTKLSMSSRTEIATWAVRSGVALDPG